MNCIVGSIEFRVLWNVATAFFLINDGETIVNKAFPSLGRYRCCFNGHFFDIFHADIFATTGLTGLPIAHPCICLSVEDEVVVGKDMT